MRREILRNWTKGQTKSEGRERDGLSERETNSKDGGTGKRRIVGKRDRQRRRDGKETACWKERQTKSEGQERDG